MDHSEVCSIIAEAQRKQLAKPTKAIVNSEAAFVAQRLRDEGNTAISKRYWSWTCGAVDEFNDEVNELQRQLKLIDAQSTMPSWGTYGT